MWAATVSASGPAARCRRATVRISGGTFLLSFTYCSNCEIDRARQRRPISRSSYTLDVRQRRHVGHEIGRRRPGSRPCARARRLRPAPSTVPSGSFSSCRMVATVPTVYRSCGARVVDVRLPSARPAGSRLSRRHGLVERQDRLVAADEQRNHHVRIDHDVAQRAPARVGAEALGVLRFSSGTGYQLGGTPPPGRHEGYVMLWAMPRLQVAIRRTALEKASTHEIAAENSKRGASSSGQARC